MENEEKELKELTDKQKKFCEEYVFDWNATRAAKAAGYSEKTARQIGSETLSKPYIQAYIEEIQKDIAKLAGISKLSVLNTLQEIVSNKDSEEVATRDRLKALEIQNKMLGFNEAEKKDITSGGKSISPMDWIDDE